MNERERLQAAIEDLYATFERYTHRRTLLGCDHCVDPADSARLLRTPLRELTPEDLGSYAFSALSTWGDEDDWKRFLPRISELLAFEPRAWNRASAAGPEIVLEKLARARWHSWPAPELGATLTFLRALWTFVLSVPPEELSADDVLVGLAQAVDRITLDDVLDEWRSSVERSPAAAIQLGELVLRNAGTLVKKRALWNAFWASEEPMRRVVSWLVEPATRAALERAFFAHAEHAGARTISDGFESLTGVAAFLGA